MKFIIFVLLITSLSAKKNYGNIIIDQVVFIYDGDTFKVNIGLYPDIIGNKMSIRLNGVDTPEIRAKCDKEKNLAKKAKRLTVLTLKGAKVIELRNIQKGKYFRIVADVYADNKSLADILIHNKLAIRYDGGTKIKNWCID